VTKSPLVSVIIPAFNAEDFIVPTIRSVLEQSWTRTEIIVIDDGSTDSTSGRVETLGERIKVIRQNRHGASAARNTGLNAARGTHIQFLDADDVLSPSKIELQMKALEFANERTIASCSWAHFERDVSRAAHQPEPVWTIEDPVEWLVASLSGEGMMQPAAWLTPRSVIDAAGSWDESLTLHDDGEFFTRVLLCAERNLFVRDAIVYYRNVPGSLSRQRNRAAVESALKVCRARHRLLLKARDDKASRTAIATQYAQFAYEFFRQAPDLAHEALEAITELDTEPALMVGGASFRILAASVGFQRALKVRRVLS
jgi:glycosyltransferase involved in cell wall biosynthesis